MDKLLLFPGATDRGIFTYLIHHEHQHLTKTAAEYHPAIASYINAAKPIPGKTQILLTALGAGEWWGCNVNGDYFPEGALAHEGADYGYKTFEKYAKIYKHHINKDPKASYGDVPLSVYNHKYHRVELIVALDNAKAPDIAERIENGEYPEWSMGCRVPYDVCSICGNKAPTRKEYCTHARYYLGKIDPETGKQVYVINTLPKFFDISQVLIGADKIAKTLRKVAHAGRYLSVPSSAYIAERMLAGDKLDKAATIEKEIPANEAPSGAQEILSGASLIRSREKDLPSPLLSQLSLLPLKQVLSTLAMLQILPKPQEMQRIVLVSLGHRGLADRLDQENLCFDPEGVDPTPEQLRMIDHRNFSRDVMDMMHPHMADRSYAPHHLSHRISNLLEKDASERPLPKLVKVSDRKPVGIFPILLATAGLYAALAKKAPIETVNHVDRLIMENPGLAAALGLGLYATFNALTASSPKGNPVMPADQNPDWSPPEGAIERMRSSSFVKAAAQGGSFAKRLALIPAVYMASGVMQKHQEYNPYQQEGAIRGFIRKNPDVVGAAIALDALAASQGKGSHKILSKFAGPEKQAGASDYAQGLGWALAFPGAGLPSRILGGMIDQAVIDGTRKVLSNHKNPNKLKVTTPEDK